MVQRRGARGGCGGVIWAATIGLGGLAACSPQATLRSSASPNGTEPITRLVVYSDIESPAMTHVASTAFEAGMVRRLAACGVEARIVSADRMDLTPPEARVEAALARLEASAVMNVKATGGEVGDPSLLYITLDLTDVRTRERTWVAGASAYFSASDTAGARDGAAFATLLVTRLRDDGVLTHCKPGETYPGCFDDLRQALAARQRAVDPGAAEPLPRCSAPREAR